MLAWIFCIGRSQTQSGQFLSHLGVPYCFLHTFIRQRRVESKYFAPRRELAYILAGLGDRLDGVEAYSL